MGLRERTVNSSLWLICFIFHGGYPDSGPNALPPTADRDSLEIPRPRTPQPRIHYTCMNSWMQLGLLRDLLHLHELVIGNLAFISDSSVGALQGTRRADPRRGPARAAPTQSPRGLATPPGTAGSRLVGGDHHRIFWLGLSKPFGKV